MIIHLSKPCIGCQHDAFVLQESGLLEVLRQHCRVGDIHYCLYDDPAYPMSSHLYRPYLGNNLQPEQRRFNEQMSRMREAVEWGYAQIVRYFA